MSVLRTKSSLMQRRRSSIIAFEMIRLDRASTEPLHLQLYRQIRDELKLGSFGNGAARLPSSRALAADLGIARLTVKLAFSKLDAEGYLASNPRSGTFVAYPLPETFLNAAKSKAYPVVGRSPRIADRVKELRDERIASELDLGTTCASPGASLIPSIP